MTTEPDLLKAVLDKPDLDPPRAAYAAWWSAQPDPALKARAEFVRTQLALVSGAARMGHEERHKLGYRESDLLKAHARAWDRPLAAMVASMKYDRGFAELVVAHAAEFLQRAPQVFALAPVRHLDLTMAALSAEKLFASPYLARVRSLSLNKCGLTDAHMELLAASPHAAGLRWLSLDENALTVAGADAIARSPHLKRLAYASFYGNPVDPSDRYATDGDDIASVWKTPEGKLLEGRHGPLPWLRRGGPTIADVVPDRFRTAP